MLATDIDYGCNCKLCLIKHRITVAL